MTDKQIIETIKRIKTYCLRLHLKTRIEENPCEYCEFYSKHITKRKNVCQLMQLLGNMTCEPRCWNLPKIEEIIKGETE